MLARIQQLITLGTAAIALAWAVASWRAGCAPCALLGLVFILCAYAGFLAIEFALVAAIHGADPTPRPQPAQLLRAWWGELVAAPVVFCWRQPFQSQRVADHVPADGHGRRGVVLVHGFVCNRAIWNPWLDKLTAGNTPFVAVNLEPVFGSVDEYACIIDAAVRRVRQCTGVAPLVVAHSMGGLAVRRWLANAGRAEDVHHIITIATPHQGTWLARFGFSRNSRQMRQGSRWLRMLSQSEPANLGARFTCFYGDCDNIVFPPQCATLPGADNRLLSAVAHVHMISRAEPWHELQRLINQPPLPN